MLSYWRGGYYKPSSQGNDGYALSKTLYTGSTNYGIHSANYKPAKWQIDGDEMNRVLAYWRAGGYHVDLSTPDGYAPTNSGPGPSMVKFAGAMLAGSVLDASVTQAGPATYTPGQTLTITCTFTPGADQLLALLWKPQLPAGWTIVSVSGDGSPELVRGEILCVGTLPATAFQLTYTVTAPAAETKACTFGMVASYLADGMANAADLNATPIVILSANAALTANGLDPLGGSALMQGVMNADFDGDGIADPALYDESTGTWHVKFSALAAGQVGASGNGERMVASGSLGGPGWSAAAADYDGDGIADPAVYQESSGNWSVKLSGKGYEQVDLAGFLGGPGWSAAPADYDGDGLADPAVYQEATGNWKVKLSSAGYAETALDNFLGGLGNSAVSADYDGDGLADPAVYNRATGTWAILLSGGGYANIQVLPEFLGGANWMAVPGDYDGDGFADPAVFQPATGHWIQKLSSGGYVSVNLKSVFGEK